MADDVFWSAASQQCASAVNSGSFPIGWPMKISSCETCIRLVPKSRRRGWASAEIFKIAANCASCPRHNSNAWRSFSSLIHRLVDEWITFPRIGQSVWLKWIEIEWNDSKCAASSNDWSAAVGRFIYLRVNENTFCWTGRFIQCLLDLLLRGGFAEKCAAAGGSAIGLNSFIKKMESTRIFLFNSKILLLLPPSFPGSRFIAPFSPSVGSGAKKWSASSGAGSSRVALCFYF